MPTTFQRKFVYSTVFEGPLKGSQTEFIEAWNVWDQDLEHSGHWNKIEIEFISSTTLPKLTIQFISIGTHSSRCRPSSNHNTCFYRMQTQTMVQPSDDSSRSIRTLKSITKGKQLYSLSRNPSWRMFYFQIEFTVIKYVFTTLSPERTVHLKSIGLAPNAFLSSSSTAGFLCGDRICLHLRLHEGKIRTICSPGLHLHGQFTTFRTKFAVSWRHFWPASSCFRTGMAVPFCTDKIHQRMQCISNTENFTMIFDVYWPWQTSYRKNTKSG